MSLADATIAAPQSGSVTPAPWWALLTHRYTELVLTVGGYLLAFAVLWGAVFRIDFHADEAIYLHGIPVNIGNDAGLFYHVAYLIGTLGEPTPASARIASLVLGMLLIATVAATFQCWFPRYRAVLPALVALMVTLSYQGIFLIVRVRPELSWVLASALAVCFLSYAETTRRPVFAKLSLLAILLLPMNHRLVWFPCAFLGLYLLLFASRTLGWKFVAQAVTALALGVVLNIVLRAWWVGTTSAHAFSVAFTPTAMGARQNWQEFLNQVYWWSGQFAKDSAANRSFWDCLLPMSIRHKYSHFFFASVLWAACLGLPMLARTWRARFVMLFPTFALVGFQLSGYYNPAYSAIFSLFGMCAALYIALEQSAWRRGVAVALLVLSVFNGLSFLATRVFNHDQATLFAVEQEIRDYIAALPPEASIAYPERLMSVGARHPGPKTVLFKGQLPADVDVVVVDDYDYEMYRFVPDYDKRRAELATALANCREVRTYALPVYESDKLYDAGEGSELPPTRQGNWYYRNSVTYRTAILTAAPDGNLR